jgi:RAD54-like protein 2
LRYTKIKSILIVVPINTIQNWATEFNRWCPIDDPTIDYKRPYQLYILNDASKKFSQRAKIVQNWTETGGTLIIGYEMFRLLVTKKCSQTSTTTKNRTMMGVASPSTPLAADGEDEDKSIETMEGKRENLTKIIMNYFLNIEISNALINPDLVICDEGHRIKNHQASVAMALKSIRTQYENLTILFR